MYVVVHMLDFLNCFTFPLSSHGELLDYMLPVCPAFYSLHNIYLWTWKKKRERERTPLSLLVISLIDLWHGVGENFTSQLAVVCDTVYCRPYLSVHGASSQCSEAVKDSNNHFPAYKLLKQVKGRTASTVTKWRKDRLQWGTTADNYSWC